MPITLRDKNTILQSILAGPLAGNIATDIAQIAVLRQLAEGEAAEHAERGYELYTLLNSFYISTAQDEDLNTRGRDLGLERDPGQAASDTVLMTRLTSHIEDIPLPAPQVVQAILADGTIVLYRSLGDVVLQPSGRSISGQAPGTTLTGSSNDRVALNLDGDGIRTVILGTQTTGVGIATALQVAVRALTANSPSHQAAYTTFRCDYSVTTAGAYTLRSGTAGPTSSVVVTVAGTNNASATLKLGLAQGGLERLGQDSLSLPVVCDTIGVIGNVAAGHIDTQRSPVTGIDTVANPLMFANGREPASDDAYRQDIRSWIHSLGHVTKYAIERAVLHTLGSDGQTHVLTAQVVYGVNTIQVFVCDGRSLTAGAQTDIIQAVQDELDGLGQEIGGWIPGGNVAGVTAATILPISLTVTVLIGPTPDLIRAQSAIANGLYRLLYGWPVGQALDASALRLQIDKTVVEMLGVTFTVPTAFSTNPPTQLGGGIGVKIMPATIAVTVLRG